MTVVRAGARARRVYFMTRGRAQRLPTPPPFHNKGNWIFSLSRLTRWMARAGRGARRVRAARDRRRCGCWSTAARCAACRPRRRASTATATRRPAPRRRPRSWRRRRCWPRARRAISAASRSTTSRSGALPAGLRARRQGGLEGREAARPDHPHARLAAALVGEVRRVRRLVHLPDGPRAHLRRLRRRARVHRQRPVAARRAAGVQDAPVHPAPAGGRRAGRLGREDDPVGRLPLDPRHARAARRGADRRLGRHGQHAEA